MQLNNYNANVMGGGAKRKGQRCSTQSLKVACKNKKQSKSFEMACGEHKSRQWNAKRLKARHEEEGKRIAEGLAWSKIKTCSRRQGKAARWLAKLALHDSFIMKIKMQQTVLIARWQCVSNTQAHTHIPTHTQTHLHTNTPRLSLRPHTPRYTLPLLAEHATYA